MKKYKNSFLWSLGITALVYVGIIFVRWEWKLEIEDRFILVICLFISLFISIWFHVFEIGNELSESQKPFDSHQYERYFRHSEMVFKFFPAIVIVVSSLLSFFGFKGYKDFSELERKLSHCDSAVVNIDKKASIINKMYSAYEDSENAKKEYEKKVKSYDSLSMELKNLNNGFDKGIELDIISNKISGSLKNYSISLDKGKKILKFDTIKIENGSTLKVKSRKSSKIKNEK